LDEIFSLPVNAWLRIDNTGGWGSSELHIAIRMLNYYADSKKRMPTPVVSLYIKATERWLL